ncbi:hypothetical protein X801_03471, partial [Opisthorchis viverrini]
AFPAGRYRLNCIPLIFIAFRSLNKHATCIPAFPLVTRYMTSPNSSLTYWTDKEIYPNGIFLTTSGSGGDRLLFWQPAPHRREDASNPQKQQSTAPEVTASQTENKDDGSRKSSHSANLCALAEQTSNRPESAHNPFALHLITDRPAAGDTTLYTGIGASGATGLLTVSTGTDRGLGNTPSATSGFVSSGMTSVNSATSSTQGGTTATTGVSYAHNPGDSAQSSLVDGGLERKSLIGTNGISTIEGLPANLVLSLLHQQFQGLQRKIYTKLDYRVFVGAAFNVTPTREETGEAASAGSPSSRPDATRSGRSMISFAVVFSMNEAASPSVLSYYTELARLIRRAELISDYLTRQRDFIVSLMDRSSPGFCPTSNYAHIEPTGPETVTSDSREQPLRRPQKLGSLVETNSSAPGGPTDWKRTGQTSENNKTDGIIEGNRVCRQSVTSVNSPFDQLVAMSSLRNELKTIIDSVCLSGHVSVMINKLHPVFFCLPHKAYSLAPKHSGGPIPAIRPAAVWRAMDKIRPYHTLLLLPRKQDLLQKQLPQEINEAMVEFINDLSPSVSLSELALRTHSQMHCLTLALWLIYQGHAIIVYPIVANNTYVLSPHYAAWFSAPLVAQFATMFPTVNLAKLLASFSTGLTLKEHLEDRKTENGTKSNGRHPVPSNTVNHPDSFWTGLSYNVKVELISWLLRRRLIIQVHIYVFLTLTPETLKKVKVSDAVHQTNGSTPNEHFRYSQESPLNSDTMIPVNDSPPGPTCTSFPTISQQESHQCKLPPDVLSKLYKLFPTDFHQAVVETLLKHPGATQNIALLQLFALILPHLPAHLEELMFHLGVSRATLIECVERFSPILCTVRLPDPVTACFSGVDWPD